MQPYFVCYKIALTRRSAGTAAAALATRGADDCGEDRRLRSARPASLFLFVDEQARTTTCTADAFLFSVCSWAVRGDVQHTIPWCASLAVTRSKFPDRARLRSREHADAVSTGSPPVGGAAAPHSEPSVAERQGAHGRPAATSPAQLGGGCPPLLLLARGAARPREGVGSPTVGSLDRLVFHQGLLVWTWEVLAWVVAS